MAGKSENPIIQKVTTAQGEDLDLSFLRVSNYVETLDLSGPRLMLEFSDPEGILRMDYSLKENDDLTVAIADPYHRDGMDLEMKFVIKKAPLVGSTLKVLCVQRDIESLKTPSAGPVFFTRKPAGQLLSRFLPGVAQEVGSFPVVEDYHLLPGERPSRLLRQAALEQGAVAFFQRGKMCFQKLSELYAKESQLTYHYNDARKENQVGTYQKPNVDAIIKDKISRKYSGWSPTKGFVGSATATAGTPVEWRPHANVATLNNLGTIGMPAIDFVCHGNGYLMPGVSLSFVWNMERSDAPIDETLPEKVVVSAVAHYYSRQKYFCRVKGVIPA